MLESQRPQAPLRAPAEVVLLSRVSPPTPKPEGVTLVKVPEPSLEVTTHWGAGAGAGLGSMCCRPESPAERAKVKDGKAASIKKAEMV